MSDTKWELTYAACPHCGWLHDTENLPAPSEAFCDSCHKPFRAPQTVDAPTGLPALDIDESDGAFAFANNHLGHHGVLEQLHCRERQLRSALAALSHAQKQLREQNGGWISVSERLPEDDTEVLSLNNFGAQRIAAWSDEDWYLSSGKLGDINSRSIPGLPNLRKIEITHWQPLPAAPGELKPSAQDDQKEK